MYTTVQQYTLTVHYTVYTDTIPVGLLALRVYLLGKSFPQKLTNSLPKCHSDNLANIHVKNKIY